MKIIEKDMTRKKLGFRNLFYFRMGYTVYFAIAVGVVNTLSSTYFLAIKNFPLLHTVFPTFTSYAIISALLGTPIVILAGWLHLKRVGTFAAEADVTNEIHPYNYKLAQGFLVEVFGPAYLMILKINIKKVKGEKLDEKELSEIAKLEEQLKKLINGGSIGSPPKGAI